MGIPNSAFSRLCAALRTPMALFSSSSSGWLRGWLQQVLVKQSARSFDQYIFDTQSIGEKKKQTAKPPKPQTKHKTKNQNTKPKPLQRHRAVIQLFLFCREGWERKEGVFTSYFSSPILHQNLPPQVHCRLVWFTWRCAFSYPWQPYLESTFMKILFTLQMTIKITLGSL